MGFNDHIDFELSARLDWLIANGVFKEKSAAEGIAKQVAANGTGSMTEAQRAVYEGVISPALAQYAADIDDGI